MTKKEMFADSILRLVYLERHIYEFGLYYFPAFFPIKSAPFHPEMVENLQFDGFNRLILEAMRDSAKTTWAKIKIIHAICYGYKRFIPVVSHDSSRAEKHLFDIAIQLQTNPLLIQDFGQLFFPESDADMRKSQKKSMKTFITVNGIQVTAYSTQQSIRGEQYMAEDGVFRPDLILLDDFENAKTVKSIAMTSTVISFISEMIPALSADCDVIFCCNKIAKNGSVAYIETLASNNPESWRVWKKALIEGGKITWPGKFVWTQLEEKILNSKIPDPKKFVKSVESVKSDLGTRNFEAVYNNNPQAIGSEMIKETWIDANTFYVPPNIEDGRVVITLDPQAGQKQTADEYALTVLFCPKGSSHRYTIEQVAGRASQLYQAALFISKVQQYSPYVARAAIEVVLNQTAVYQLCLDWKARKINFKDTLSTVDDENRNVSFFAYSPEGKDKVTRLQLQEASFERGEIHLKPEMQILKDQLMYLHLYVNKKGAHDDRADSLIAALELANKINWVHTDGNNDGKKQEQDKSVAGNLKKTKF